MSGKKRANEASPKRVRALTGFGRALQAVREGAGLSQGEVCRRAEISPAALSRYEAGQSWPRMDTLDAVLSAMEKDVLDLGLALYREQAEARAREEGAFDRPDLLATPTGRQILDHSRLLFYTGKFWIDAALALLPAARRGAARSGEQAKADPQDGAEEAHAGSGTG